MCKYCYERDGSISGKMIYTFEWKKTAGYKPERNSNYYKDWVDPNAFEELQMFILKEKDNEKAGLMINTMSGARYIDINYCPMCR